MDICNLNIGLEYKPLVQPDEINKFVHMPTYQKLNSSSVLNTSRDIAMHQ